MNLLLKLDLTTVEIINISVTVILGAMLLFAWMQNRAIRSLWWWGTAHFVLAAAIVFLTYAGLTSEPVWNSVGLCLLVLSYGLMWNAARVFDRRASRPVLVAAGPCGWVVAKTAGIGDTFDEELILTAVMNAGYCLLAAFEYWRGRAEPLISRWPAVLLLVVTGFGYFTWVPLTVFSPFTTGEVHANAWFPLVILVTLLGRVALAFIVLAMAKERLELQQRTQALTDPLTGLPNRRAFFRSALRRIRSHSDPVPMTVLAFDLDHFKEINDKFGHAVGDRVLTVFAETLTNRLQATDILGRMGGEEFVAFLPATDLRAAGYAAERVRASFALSAVSVDGITIGATVSVGVAEAMSPHCDLHEMLERADFALYTAKNSGRNRVEFADNSNRQRILPKKVSPRTVPHIPAAAAQENQTVA